MSEEETLRQPSERENEGPSERESSPPSDSVEPLTETSPAAETLPTGGGEGEGTTTAAQPEPAGEAEAEEEIEVSYQVTEVGPCRKRVAVTIERTVYEEELEKQLSEVAREVVTPGFRKGRAPRRIIERRYGKAVGEEVKRNLVLRGLQRALKEADLTPLREPELGEVELGEDGPLTFEATFDVYPKVEIKDYKGLPITKPAVSVGERDIDRAIRRIREERGRLVPVADPEATVEKEDLVVCDYRLICDDRAVLERTDVTIPVLLTRWPEVPEASPERLLGAKAGQTIKTPLELTDQKWPEDLRGKEANLEVTVHEIKRVELAELSEELLRELGAESVEDLRAKVEMALLRQREREVQREVEEQLERQLLEQADFDLPESLISEQAARSAAQARLRLMQMGVPQEEIDARAAEIAAAGRDRAVRDLKLHFILEHIAEKENIQTEPRDLEERLNLIANRYNVSPRQVRLWLEKDGSLDALRQMIRQEKTTAWLLQQAEVTELEPEVELETSAPEGT